MTDGTATDLDAIAGWVTVLREANAAKARAEETAALARTKIEEALGDNEIGLVDGAPAVRWVHVTSTRFDQKKAKAILGDAAEACMVATESRRFTLVDPA